MISCQRLNYYAEVNIPLHHPCQIYLLSEEQRVKVIIRGEPDYVGSFRDTFAEFVSTITGTIINVDNIRTHKDSGGDPDGRRYVGQVGKVTVYATTLTLTLLICALKLSSRLITCFSVFINKGYISSVCIIH